MIVAGPHDSSRDCPFHLSLGRSDRIHSAHSERLPSHDYELGS
jgi:hypothetical protein